MTAEVMEKLDGLEGQALVDALLAMGAEEVRNRQGRIAYRDPDNFYALTCTSCIKLKPVSKFRRKKGVFADLRSDCKACASVTDKLYRKKNVGRIRENDRKYRERSGRRVGGYARHLRERDPEKYQTYLKEQQVRVSNHRRLYPQRIVEQNRDYYERNRPRLLEYKKTYYRKNKGAYRLTRQNRRAKEVLLPSKISVKEYENTVRDLGEQCVLTGSRTNLDADHSIPISVGHGGTIRENMVPLEATLNSSKSNAHLFEWYEANHERFSLPRAKFDALIEWLAEANEMSTQEYRAYVDWCFDNPAVIDEATQQLVFKDGPLKGERSQRETNEEEA